MYVEFIIEGFGYSALASTLLSAISLRPLRNLVQVMVFRCNRACIPFAASANNAIVNRIYVAAGRYPALVYDVWPFLPSDSIASIVVCPFVLSLSFTGFRNFTDSAYWWDQMEANAKPLYVVWRINLEVEKGY